MNSNIPRKRKQEERGSETKAAKCKRYINYENLFSGFNFTNYIDKCLSMLRKRLADGVDPMYIQPSESTFQYGKGFINLTGTLAMDNTELHYLSTVARSGNPKIKFKDKHLDISWQMIFKELEMRSSYYLKLLNLGRNGEVRANVKNLLADIAFRYDFANLKMSLQDVKLQTNRSLDVEISGNATDRVSSAIIKVVTNLFKSQILKSVEDVIREKIEETLPGIQVTDEE